MKVSRNLSLFVLLICGFTQPIMSYAVTPGAQYEQRVLEVSNLIEAGHLEVALSKADEVLKSYPKSRITHLMKADILRAMNGELSTIADGVDHCT